MRLSRFIVICGALATSGCVVTSEFYLPSAPGGRVERAHCPPLRSFILFERMGTVIGVKSARTGAGALEVTVTLEIPQDNTFQWVAPTVHGRNSNGDEADAPLAFVSKEQGLAWNTALTGSTEKRLFERGTMYGVTEHAYYVLRARLELPEAQVHTIDLPAAILNGTRTKLPSIEFRIDSEAWLFSGNC